jgi:hypothetical protein
MKKVKPHRKSVMPIAIAASVFMVLLLAVAFFMGLVPDVPDMIREPIALSMVRHTASRASFERFLKLSGAKWHVGYGYQRGEAYSAFDVASRTPCAVECDSVVQAAFTTWFGICVITGDVVSARYNESGKLKTWNLDEAVDGC